MKTFYKDFYGCTASIHSRPNYAELIVRDPYGRKVFKKTYSSQRGARIALGKQSDCWREVTRA